MGAPNTKVVEISESVTSDVCTGEVRTTETVTTFRVPKEPPYVKVYLNDLSALLELPKGAGDVMYELLKLLDYEGCVSLNPVIRQRICESVGIKPQSLKNSLQKLKKAEVLLPLGTNCYQCNPKYFARGEWRDVMRKRKEFEELTLKVTYDKKGRRNIVTELRPSIKNSTTG